MLGVVGLGLGVKTLHLMRHEESVLKRFCPDRHWLSSASLHDLLALW